MELKNGPLALAIGVEHRKEELNDQPQSVLFSGDILGGGGALPPTAADRTVHGLLRRAEHPDPEEPRGAARRALRRLQRLRQHHQPEGGAALDADQGGAGPRARTAPASARRRSPTCSCRASCRTRPTRTTTRSAARTPRPIGGFVNAGLECDAQFQNQQGGNTALQPEKSRQWTVGVIWEPTRRRPRSAPTSSTIRRKDSIGALGDTTVFDVFGAADPLNAGGRFVRTARLAGGGCVGDLPGAPTPANVPCPIDFVVQVQENLGNYVVTGVDLTGIVRFPRPATASSRCAARARTSSATATSSRRTARTSTTSGASPPTTARSRAGAIPSSSTGATARGARRDPELPARLHRRQRHAPRRRATRPGTCRARGKAGAGWA